MKLFHLLLLCSLLTGCVTDNGAGFVATVSALPTALTSQDQLEFDLRKDLVRRSAELEFLSNGTYSCGDPNSAYILDSESYYRALEKRNAKKPDGWNTVVEIRKKQREKDDLLQAVLIYGEQMKALTADFEFARSGLATIRSQVAALQKGGGLSEAGTVLTGLNAVLQIAETSAGLAQSFAVVEAARAMQDGLVLAAKKLSADQVLARLTRDEAIAFSFWDACQTERLRFIRDWFYPVYKPRTLVDRNGHPLFQGMDRSSVIDFSREYRQYQLDREGFIARRPNFVSLISAVLEANKKILAAPDREAILAAGKALVDATATIQPAAVTLASQ